MFCVHANSVSGTNETQQRSNREMEWSSEGLRLYPSHQEAVGEGRHRTKPLIPAVGPGGTDCAVELLTEEAETSLILM